MSASCAEDQDSDAEDASDVDEELLEEAMPENGSAPLESKAGAAAAATDVVSLQSELPAEAADGVKAVEAKQDAARGGGFVGWIKGLNPWKQGAEEQSPKGGDATVTDASDAEPEQQLEEEEKEEGKGGGWWGWLPWVGNRNLAQAEEAAALGKYSASDA